MAGPEGIANTEVLEELGFVVSQDYRMPGAGSKLEITEATVAKIQEMVGKFIIVQDGGQLVIE